MNLTSFFACIVAAVFIAICAFYIATRGPLAGSPGWTMEGLVTVVLASVTVVLAAIGVGVAALTVWGYEQFMKHARAAAEHEAGTVATRVAVETVNALVPRLVESRLEGGGSGNEIARSFSRGDDGGPG